MSAKSRRSSQPSATNVPPEGPVFFLDRSLGTKLVAERLRREGAIVELHGDHFQHDTADEVWIPEVAARDWVILAKDLRIRWRPLEREAIEASGARVFVFSSGNVTGEDMAEAFARAMPRMERLVGQMDGPFIAKVYRDGSVKMWKDWVELT